MSFTVCFFFVMSLANFFFPLEKTYPPYVRHKTLVFITCLFLTFLSLLFAAHVKVFPLLLLEDSLERNILWEGLLAGARAYYYYHHMEKRKLLYWENKKYRCIITIDPCSLIHLCTHLWSGGYSLHSFLLFSFKK